MDCKYWQPVEGGGGDQTELWQVEIKRGLRRWGGCRAWILGVRGGEAPLEI